MSKLMDTPGGSTSEMARRPRVVRGHTSEMAGMGDPPTDTEGGPGGHLQFENSQILEFFLQSITVWGVNFLTFLKFLKNR
jgi:hypothetical protein